ncbi:ABC transporter ATP-binding protein [Lysinibacter cavernae]|uniref:ABC-type multidrug transport system ATPase subunit n=1 Tax=Lysinibacter cavernae TaxID=1640652 RepID=A0A7X5R3U8_9MICO|nr:ABC transporter ATP-binding protein [Lysinibacter cavernae]NIH55076.1 ABC-type multidrug transport system ATPase subunit [Lysinibacter cavernae]
MATMIEAANVSVTVDGQSLLAPVSFTVDEGQALAVRGANGAGKTTLLRTVAGFQRPSTGSIRLSGTRVDEKNRAIRREVCALIGFPAIAPDLTLREQLRFIASSWGILGSSADEAADGVLAELGIDLLAQRFVHELSSGQTQLFSLATALVRPSAVLILDEPEQRLDADRRGLVIAAVNLRKAAGSTVIFASHNAQLVNGIADETLTLAGQ